MRDAQIRLLRLTWLDFAGAGLLNGLALANCLQGVCAISTDRKAQDVPMVPGTRF